MGVALGGRTGPGTPIISVCFPGVRSIPGSQSPPGGGEHAVFSATPELTTPARDVHWDTREKSGTARLWSILSKALRDAELLSGRYLAHFMNVAAGGQPDCDHQATLGGSHLPSET